MTTSIWVLVMWVYVTPPQEPVVLPLRDFQVAQDCKDAGEAESKRLGPKYLWFCIEMIDLPKRKKEAANAAGS